MLPLPCCPSCELNCPDFTIAVNFVHSRQRRQIAFQWRQNFTPSLTAWMLRSKEAGKRAEDLQKKYRQGTGRHSKTEREIRSNNSFHSLTEIPHVKFIFTRLSTFVCYIPQRKTEQISMFTPQGFFMESSQSSFWFLLPEWHRSFFLRSKECD